MDVPLKEHLERLICVLERRMDERFAARDKELKTALVVSKEALRIAENAAEKWRLELSDWREKMDERERQFLTKSMGIVLAILVVTSTILTIYMAVTE